MLKLCVRWDHLSAPVTGAQSAGSVRQLNLTFSPLKRWMQVWKFENGCVVTFNCSERCYYEHHYYAMTVPFGPYKHLLRCTWPDRFF